jgi:predicted tellurium resistance membrane protein TerC
MGMLAGCAFRAGVLEIVGVNIVFPGDNALVIAHAACSRPCRQQKQVIIRDSVAAIVVRVILTVFAVRLLTLPSHKITAACSCSGLL